MSSSLNDEHVFAPAPAADAQTPRTPLDPAAEDAHWRERHENMPWHRPDRSYEDYRPAYELGWNRRAQSAAHFEAHENDLAAEWEARRGASPLGWPEARAASRAAWDRADGIYYEQAKQVGMAESFAFVEPPPGVPDASRRASSPEAKLHDNEVVDVLNHLLENARDGEHGYRTFAQEVKAPGLRQVFEERAEQCRQAARELQPLIAQYGGTPAEGGTVLGALHRGWVQLKGAFGGDSAESMLGECERAEDIAVDRYRSALQHSLPADVRTVVERQSVQTRQQHERVKELRNDAAQARQ